MNKYIVIIIFFIIIIIILVTLVIIYSKKNKSILSTVPLSKGNVSALLSINPEPKLLSTKLVLNNVSPTTQIINQDTNPIINQDTNYTQVYEPNLSTLSILLPSISNKLIIEQDLIDGIEGTDIVSTGRDKILYNN